MLYTSDYVHIWLNLVERVCRYKLRNFCTMLSKATVFLGCLALAISCANAAHRYYWRDYIDYIPDDAFAGADGLYVAQVITKGLLPATFYPSTKEAVTEIETKRVVFKTGIKLLCDTHTSNFVWEYINIDSLTGDKLKDLVVGGLELSTTLYIGKIYHEGQWKIGKVFPPSHQYKGLRIWNNHGNVHAVDDFQILKYVDKAINIFDVRTN